MALRIGGLASGIDTEGIINELLQVERNKIDLKLQQKQLLEWKRDDYREINTKLLALRTAAFDLKLSETFNAKSAVSSNESILTATASSTATNGNYYVTVKQLAQKASMTSQQSLGSNDNISSIAAQFGIAEDAEINFTIAGSKGEMPFSFQAGDTSLADLVRIINEENIGVQAYYDSSIDRVFLMSTEMGESGAITVKMDGMRDSMGNPLKNANGECLSFLEDYLKLNVDLSSLNESAPADGRKISSNSAMVIHDDAAITLSQMYEGGTAPATVSFTLEGSEDSYDFTFDTSITLEEMINEINDQRLSTGIIAAYDSTTGQVAFITGGQVTLSNDNDNFLADKLNMTIGSQQEMVASNSAVRIYDAADIKLNYLYTCDDIQFTLEGGLGSRKFSFVAGSTSVVTVQQMIDSINSWQSSTGVTASYDGETGKITFWDSSPLAVLQEGSTAANATLVFNEALYSSSDGTANGVLTALNDGEDITGRFTYSGSGSLASATYNSDGTIDFEVAGATDGDTIILNAGLDNVFDAEGNQHLAAAMVYDAAEGSWTYDNRSNEDRKIAIRYDNEGFIADELNINMYEMQGTKAIINFNDAEDLEFDSNEITLMDCINLNLNAANPGQTVRVAVNNDIDGAVEKIKAFVEAYNTAVVHMNTELTERRYNARDKYGGSYAPLTAEQKKEMSEDEIKAWEEKAKSGMLRGDSILFSAYSNTRMAATDVVKRQTMPGGNGLSIDNPYTSLASIGITTTSFNKNSVEGAKLELDESKLREALTAAPDKVAELFTLEQEVLDNEGEPILDWNGNPLYDKGIAMRLYDVVNENITAISNKAGVDTSYVDTSLMAKEIGRVDEQIKNFEERMQAMSERYWKQFTRMEKLISAYTSQSEWLTQQIEQLTSNKSN